MKSKKVTTSDVTPFGSFVLISFDETKGEKTTEAGIIIPIDATAEFKIMDAEVHRVGAVVEKDDFVHAGDKVIVPTDTIGIDMTDRIDSPRKNRVFRIVAVENIIAIIK